jgi:uncharacterized protein with HEPN domain
MAVESQDRDAAYVEDIIDSCAAIQAYVGVGTLDDYRGNAMLQDAVSRRLFVIGEAAKCLSDDFRRAMPDIDWRNIGRLRDKLGHHYWTIEVEAIWEIVTVHVPALRLALDNSRRAQR